MNSADQGKVLLKRSKSLCCLSDAYDGSHSVAVSECSEVFVVNDSDCESADERPWSTRNINEGVGHEVLSLLEHKIDNLSDLFLEQCRLLSEIKSEIEDSRSTLEESSSMQSQLFLDVVEQMLSQSPRAEEKESRAKCLLDALEVKKSHSVDKHIKEALGKFLQNDELKERMVSATVESVRDEVRGWCSRALPAALLPALRRAQRGLARRATLTLQHAFAELGENSLLLSRDVHRACRQLRGALDRHQAALQAAPAHDADSLRYTVEELLDNELKEYRLKILEMLSADDQSLTEEGPESPQPAECPSSPPQPADPNHSVIDQLMITALINKQIQEGDLNGAFSRALSAGELSLVTAACRAVPPARAFGPPRALSAAVLLSLMQQLATDMVHDTQIKCRYLEEAIISFNTTDPATRVHLPLVVGEVRKHLMTFLLSYPNHVACRRITLIVMASDYLLK